MTPSVRSAARLVVRATLAAGVVGAVRQATEARARREGRRPALGPAAGPDEDGPDGPRNLLARLADWVPAPPRTPAGRLAAALWSGPLTALGVAVAVVSGGRPTWDAERRCLVAVGVRGPSGAALRGVGAAANTIGGVILVRGTAPDPVLLDHEAVHVRQGERLGPLLPLAYAWAGALAGYAANPFERSARTGARRADLVRRGRGGRSAAGAG